MAVGTISQPASGGNGSSSDTTIQRAAVAIPFEIISDLNNDGRIDTQDRQLKTVAASSTATPADLESATEYVFVNNQVSNGLPDREDPKAPSTTTADDDAEKISVTCGATWGIVWFEHPAINALAFYSDPGCKAKITFPFTLSKENQLPPFLYVRAEGNIVAEVDGYLTMKFGPPDKSAVWAQDAISFTIVKGLGDKKYFQAARNYIQENNTLFYTDEKHYGSEDIKIVVMREEATTMTTFEGYYRNPKVYGIAAVAAANPAQSLIVNGNFVFQIDPPILMSLPGAQRMTKRCNGRRISSGILDTSVSTSAAQAPSTSGASITLSGPQASYLAQNAAGAFTFGVGEVPLNQNFREALGGVSTNFAVRAEPAVNIIGEVPVNHAGNYKLIFSAQTDPRTNTDGDKAGTLQFKADADKAGVSHWLIFDGGSSVAMAYADPNSTPPNKMTLQYGGVKHGTIVGYYVNTYLMFQCKTPR